MKRTTILLVAAACVYLLSWFVPVGEDLPGWQAFRIAVSPIWPYLSFSGESGFRDVMAVMSGLTNPGFVIAILYLKTGSRKSTRGVFWGLVLATVINVHWLVFYENTGDLWGGYYLWLSSFLLLAVTARLLLNRHDE